MNPRLRSTLLDSLLDHRSFEERASASAVALPRHVSLTSVWLFGNIAKKAALSVAFTLIFYTVAGSALVVLPI